MLVTKTDLPLPLLRRGKVRDVYEVDENTLLLVATDRISAFDVVMNEPIPHKGRVLTQLTAWWLAQLERHTKHHLLSLDVSEMVSLVPALAPHSEMLEGRATLCRRALVFPVECVIRGYITGSAWKEYAAQGTLAGERLAVDPVYVADLSPTDERKGKIGLCDEHQTRISDSSGRSWRLPARLTSPV